MLAQARSIWATVYATLDTPAVCPRKLHHPIIHAHLATCSGGTTCFVTKYMPPAVGYADTSSATVSIRERLSEGVNFDHLKVLCKWP